MVIVGGEGGGGKEEVRENGRAIKVVGVESRSGFPDILGFFAPSPGERRREKRRSPGPTVSRTAPEAHSQADGPYTRA